MKLRSIRPALLLLLLTFSSQISTLLAQGTAFTYQGALNSSGAPANGAYDLQFTVYDAASNGNIIGGPLTNSATAVSNGLFSVQLDFGTNTFNGSARWLEIGVQTNGAGGVFTTLSPRQQITSTPYAIQSANAVNANVAASASSVSATNISGTIALARLPAAVVTNGASGVTLAGTFNGNGGGLTNLNTSQLTGGTINSSLLPTNALAFSLMTLGTNVYSQSGTYTVTVPIGVTQIIAKLWGAGGGGASQNFGGGGAFVQKTITVTPGQTYILVVGQRGNFGTNDLGGNGSGNAQGGSTRADAAVGYKGGQGGQGSSLFYYTGSNYIMRAVAGAGGGAGTAAGFLGGNGAPGGNGGSAAAISNGNPAGSGNNGSGGASGTSNYSFNGSGANGFSGDNYSANATTTGINALSLADGSGGNSANTTSFDNVFYPPSNGGGGGGGYGGGGGGALTYDPQPYSGSGPAGGGGGGGSYGDIIIAGSSRTPGNTSDPNYVSPAGYGGTSSSAGSDGMAVLLLQGQEANVPASIAANILTANGSLNANGGITLNNSASNVIQFANAGVAAPADSSAGWKIRTFTPNYGIGISAGVQWYSSQGQHQWWYGNNGVYTNLMTLDNSGNLTLAGPSANLYAPGGLYFNDRNSLATYGQWAWYANGGKAYLYNSLNAGANKISVDTSGNFRAQGTVTASASPDLAETISAADDVEAGDIVSADPNKPESAVRCSVDAPAVLGVISDGTGGFLINARGNAPDSPLTGKPLVLVGRVPVKVSLENGPIKIGDELAPSSTPGVAMRATDSDRVVGIALAAFDGKDAKGGIGKVLCFVKVEHTAQIKVLKEENKLLRDRLDESQREFNARLQKLEQIIRNDAKGE